MVKKRVVTYTSDELRQASDRVMRSLNSINKQAAKPTFRPVIMNSLGRDKIISKSSQRRRARKERANLAGRSMDTLLETLPELPAKWENAPGVAAGANYLSSPATAKTQKAAARLAHHEMKTYSSNAGAGLSLKEIKERVAARHAAPSEAT